jgi:hypothetical protein
VSVLRLSDLDSRLLPRLLARYGMDMRLVHNHENIPASYWGDSEAGLSGNTLFARADTPVHSVLHEAAHYICMSPERRVGLNRDAGGDDTEENAVCYLQLLLAEQLTQVGRDRLCADMDEWGYSFRLGSTRAWFEQDAADARDWLQREGVIDGAGTTTWALRG